MLEYALLCALIALVAIGSRHDCWERQSTRCSGRPLPAASSASFAVLVGRTARRDCRGSSDAANSKRPDRHDGGAGLGSPRSVSGGVSVGAALLGCVIGLVLMLPGHVLGATGAGDVKLMAAVGSLLGPLAGRQRRALHGGRGRCAGGGGGDAATAARDDAGGHGPDDRGAGRREARDRSPGRPRAVSHTGRRLLPAACLRRCCSNQFAGFSQVREQRVQAERTRGFDATSDRQGGESQVPIDGAATRAESRQTSAARLSSRRQ